MPISASLTKTINNGYDNIDWTSREEERDRSIAVFTTSSWMELLSDFSTSTLKPIASTPWGIGRFKLMFNTPEEALDAVTLGSVNSPTSVFPLRMYVLASLIPQRPPTPPPIPTYKIHASSFLISPSFIMEAFSSHNTPIVSAREVRKGGMLTAHWIISSNTLPPRTLVHDKIRFTLVPPKSAPLPTIPSNEHPHPLPAPATLKLIPIAPNPTALPPDTAPATTPAPNLSADGVRLACEKCRQPLGSGEHIILQGQPYHQDCFVCTLCDSRLGTSGFQNDHGQFKCRSCVKKALKLIRLNPITPSPMAPPPDTAPAAPSSNLTTSWASEEEDTDMDDLVPLPTYADVAALPVLPPAPSPLIIKIPKPISLTSSKPTLITSTPHPTQQAPLKPRPSVTKAKRPTRPPAHLNEYYLSADEAIGDPLTRPQLSRQLLFNKVTSMK